MAEWYLPKPHREPSHLDFAMILSIINVYFPLTYISPCTLKWLTSRSWDEVSVSTRFQRRSAEAARGGHALFTASAHMLPTCSHPGPFCMKSYTKILLDYISGARFKKEVQLTLSLNLNSELSYSEMGNSEFAVTEQLKWVSLLNSEGWLWVMCSMTMKSHDQRSTEIMIHHGNSSR